jgi:peptidoglycan/LPS O-acetylase OafA/YrhL
VHSSAPSPLTSSLNLQRIPELDGIRGIAILTVLFYHLFSYSMFRQSWTGLAQVAIKLTDHMSHGVDLFFVLSGFLITGILLDSRSDPRFFKNFYARRALRILPLYYAVLLVILLCSRNSGSYVLLSFLHLSNMAPALGITMVNGAMWSLSVEEHFYLCWPLVVRLFRPAMVARIAAGVCLAEPVIRAIAFPYVVSVFPYSWFRLDGIAAGAWLACWVRSEGHSGRKTNRLVLGFASLGLCIEVLGTPLGIRQFHTRFGAALEFPSINLICAALVLWAATYSSRSDTRFLRSPLLRVCGDLSYCLYLSHCRVMDAYDKAYTALVGSSPTLDFRGVLLRAVAVLVGSFAIAAVSRVAIELPALRARKFFQPPERTVAAKGVAA